MSLARLGQFDWSALGVNNQAVLSKMEEGSNKLPIMAAVSLVLQQWVEFGHHPGHCARKHDARLLSGVRTSAVVEELKHRLALTCRVVRDGVERQPIGRNQVACRKQDEPWTHDKSSTAAIARTE